MARLMGFGVELGDVPFTDSVTYLLHIPCEGLDTLVTGRNGIGKTTVAITDPMRLIDPNFRSTRQETLDEIVREGGLKLPLVTYQLWALEEVGERLDEESSFLLTGYVISPEPAMRGSKAEADGCWFWALGGDGLRTSPDPLASIGVNVAKTDAAGAAHPLRYQEIVESLKAAERARRGRFKLYRRAKHPEFRRKLSEFLCVDMEQWRKLSRSISGKEEAASDLLEKLVYENRAVAYVLDWIATSSCDEGSRSEVARSIVDHGIHLSESRAVLDRREAVKKMVGALDAARPAISDIASVESGHIARLTAADRAKVSMESARARLSEEFDLLVAEGKALEAEAEAVDRCRRSSEIYKADDSREEAERELEKADGAQAAAASKRLEARSCLYAAKMKQAERDRSEAAGELEGVKRRYEAERKGTLATERTSLANRIHRSLSARDSKIAAKIDASEEEMRKGRESSKALEGDLAAAQGRARNAERSLVIADALLDTKVGALSKTLAGLGLSSSLDRERASARKGDIEAKLAELKNSSAAHGKRAGELEARAGELEGDEIPTVRNGIEEGHRVRAALTEKLNALTALREEVEQAAAAAIEAGCVAPLPKDIDGVKEEAARLASDMDAKTEERLGLLEDQRRIQEEMNLLDENMIHVDRRAIAWLGENGYHPRPFEDILMHMDPERRADLLAADPAAPFYLILDDSEFQALAAGDRPEDDMPFISLVTTTDERGVPVPADVSGLLCATLDEYLEDPEGYIERVARDLDQAGKACADSEARIKSLTARSRALEAYGSALKRAGGSLSGLIDSIEDIEERARDNDGKLEELSARLDDLTGQLDKLRAERERELRSSEACERSALAAQTALTQADEMADQAKAAREAKAAAEAARKATASVENDLKDLSGRLRELSEKVRSLKGALEDNRRDMNLVEAWTDPGMGEGGEGDDDADTDADIRAFKELILRLDREEREFDAETARLIKRVGEAQSLIDVLKGEASGFGIDDIPDRGTIATPSELQVLDSAARAAEAACTQAEAERNSCLKELEAARKRASSLRQKWNALYQFSDLVPREEVGGEFDEREAEIRRRIGRVNGDKDRVNKRFNSLLTAERGIEKAVDSLSRGLLPKRRQETDEDEIFAEDADPLDELDVITRSLQEGVQLVSSCRVRNAKAVRRSHSMLESASASAREIDVTRAVSVLKAIAAQQPVADAADTLKAVEAPLRLLIAKYDSELRVTEGERPSIVTAYVHLVSELNRAARRFETRSNGTMRITGPGKGEPAVDAEFSKRASALIERLARSVSDDIVAGRDRSECEKAILVNALSPTKLMGAWCEASGGRELHLQARSTRPEDKGRMRNWNEAVRINSTGQGISLGLRLIITCAGMCRTPEAAKSRRPPKLPLFLDNAWKGMSAGELLDPVFALAEHNGIQLIATGDASADAVRYKFPQQVSLIRQTATGRSGSVLRAGIEKRNPALATAVLGERGVAYQTEIEF